MKRLLSMILSLSLLLSLVTGLGLHVFADDTLGGECGENVTYSYDEETNTFIISGTGDMYNFVTPSMYDDYYQAMCYDKEYAEEYPDEGFESAYTEEGLAELKVSPFAENESVVNVVIEAGVTNIGENAFFDSSMLKSIQLPNGLTSIGDYAFFQCYELSEINFPDGLESIGECAFGWCDSLENIALPDSLAVMKHSAFTCCTALKDFDLPSALTVLEPFVFYCCESLTNLHIPANITLIDSCAYAGCSGLETITVDPGNAVYAGVNNAIIEKATNTLVLGCKNTVIPEGVTRIGEDAFFDCKDLQEVVLPASVTTIETSAFSGCTAVKELVLPDTVTTIGYGAFSSNRFTSVTLPAYLKTIPAQAFHHCYKMKSISIPASVTKISFCAFHQCKDLQDVYYDGTESEWNKIVIDSGNEYLTKATIHFKEDGDGSGELIFEQPDFDALDALYERKANYAAADYTPETYNALMALYDKYENLEDEIVSQNVIDEAVSEILSAIYDLVPYLNVRVFAENGTVTINGAPVSEARLPQGEIVTLTAVADEGYIFKEWLEADTKRVFSTEATINLALSSNMNLKAHFVAENTVSLIFTNASGQIVKSIDKSAAAWAAVTDLTPLLPDVPYSFGKTNGRWQYDAAEVLAHLAGGEDVTVKPVYDSTDICEPDVPLAEEEPVIRLTYQLDETDANNHVASFVMAVGIPENITVKEMGTAFYYKKAASFNPKEYDLILNSKVLTSKFTEFDQSGVYVTNISKFTSKYNWAVRGYITYIDAEGTLKTVYSNQINIIDCQQQ